VRTVAVVCFTIRCLQRIGDLSPISPRAQPSSTTSRSMKARATIERAACFHCDTRTLRRSRCAIPSSIGSIDPNEWPRPSFVRLRFSPSGCGLVPAGCAAGALCFAGSLQKARPGLLRSAISAFTIAIIGGEIIITYQNLRRTLIPTVKRAKSESNVSMTQIGGGTRFSSMVSRFSHKLRHSTIE